MKKLLVFGMALALLLSVGRVFADNSNMHKDMKKDDTQASGKTMKCEVIDVACYVGKGAKGEAHQACAAKCISGGGELALLYDGKLYIPVDKNFHSARSQFVSKGGEMVKVTGKTVSKGGVNYLILSDTTSSDTK